MVTPLSKQIICPNTVQIVHRISHIQTSIVAAPLSMSSAEECVRFERESFGALHQMLTGVDEADRESVWDEITTSLRQFETPDGFVGPCEMLVAVETK